MQHQYGVEIWTAEQTAKPANSYPIQLPGHARVIAPDTASALEQGKRIAEAKYGKGCSVHVTQHHRYQCCKLPDGTMIDHWLTATSIGAEQGILAYGKAADNTLVAVRTADGTIKPAGRRAGM